MARVGPYRKASGEPVDDGGDAIAGAGRGGERGGWPGISRGIIVLLGIVLVAGIIALVSGSEAPFVFQTCVWGVLLVPLVVAAWMLGIALTGRFATAGCFSGSPSPNRYRMIVAIALGLGTLSLGTLLLGTVHLLTVGGHPWPLLVLPIAAAAIGFLPTRNLLEQKGREPGPTARSGDWLMLLAGVPVAMLIIAATFPPGSLWASEARGYDAMEYHLELPREFADLNSTAPLAHNVYSYFPANIEMLYLMLTQLAKITTRDSSHLQGAFPSQFLHVGFMLLTAAAIALMPLGKRGLSATGRAIAVLLFLGVPWTIVTGSLAYNEGGMLLFGTLALGVALGGDSVVTSAGIDPAAALPNAARTRGILIGLLLGLAVGCKLTAGVCFALPVAAILLFRSLRNTDNLKTLAISILLATLLYVPWALRAAIASGGNPLFPIATSLLGRDGWTPEQSDRFDRGHSAPAAEASTTGRTLSLIQNSLFDPQWSPSLNSAYLWTHYPPPDDSAWLQLGLLWMVLPLGVLLALVNRHHRRASILMLLVLLLQLFAWMYMTHLKSRFLLPIAVPLAVLAGLATETSGTERNRLLLGGLRVLFSTGVAIHALCTVFLLLPEAGLLGGTAHADGKLPPPQPIGQLLWHQVNVAAMAAQVESHASPDAPLENLPPEKVLLVGDSTVWRYTGGSQQIVYSTVFDHSLLHDVLVQNDPSIALALLQRPGIHFVLIDWTEVNRFRDTYGFDDAIVPEAIPKLKADGLIELPLPEFPNIALFRVPAPPATSPAAAPATR